MRRSLNPEDLEQNQARQPISCNISNKENKHLNKFMTDILNKSIVLVLNRNWQAIHVRTPQEAFCMMATNVATGLEIEGEDNIRPVTWEEWITLSIRPPPARRPARRR